MAAVIETGVVGVNIEDARPGEPGVLFDVSAQVERLGAARAAADASGVPMFINARCDVFFGASVPAEHALDEVRTRAQAYADAGADGLFLPGLIDLATIEAVVAAIDLPLNVMVIPGLPILRATRRRGRPADLARRRRRSSLRAGCSMRRRRPTSLVSCTRRCRRSAPGVSVLPSFIR